MRINNSGTVGISTDGSNFTTSGDSGAGLLRGFTVQHIVQPTLMESFVQRVTMVVL